MQNNLGSHHPEKGESKPKAQSSIQLPSNFNEKVTGAISDLNVRNRLLVVMANAAAMGTSWSAFEHEDSGDVSKGDCYVGLVDYVTTEASKAAGVSPEAKVKAAGLVQQRMKRLADSLDGKFKVIGQFFSSGFTKYLERKLTVVDGRQEVSKADVENYAQRGIQAFKKAGLSAEVSEGQMNDIFYALTTRFFAERGFQILEDNQTQPFPLGAQPTPPSMPGLPALSMTESREENLFDTPEFINETNKERLRPTTPNLPQNTKDEDGINIDIPEVATSENLDRMKPFTTSNKKEASDPLVFAPAERVSAKELAQTKSQKIEEKPQGRFARLWSKVSSGASNAKNAIANRSTSKLTEWKEAGLGIAKAARSKTNDILNAATEKVVNSKLVETLTYSGDIEIQTESQASAIEQGQAKLRRWKRITEWPGAQKNAISVDQQGSTPTVSVTEKPTPQPYVPREMADFGIVTGEKLAKLPSSPQESPDFGLKMADFKLATGDKEVHQHSWRHVELQRVNNLQITREPRINRMSEPTIDPDFSIETRVTNGVGPIVPKSPALLEKVREAERAEFRKSIRTSGARKLSLWDQFTYETKIGQVVASTIDKLRDDFYDLIGPKPEVAQ